jgi:hypothetical protein
MRAVVHRVDFPDLDQSWPFDPANTRQLVEICASPPGSPPGEYFSLTVCTPAALAEVLAGEPAVVGRHWLFVAEFDAAAVERFLRKAVQGIEGRTWNEVAEKIGRLGHWEFEDYRG